jgi:L-ascorbate peroxidase
MAASDAAQLKSAREDIKEILKTTYCHPILVRIFTLQISSTL